MNVASPLLWASIFSPKLHYGLVPMNALAFPMSSVARLSDKLISQWNYGSYLQSISGSLVSLADWGGWLGFLHKFLGVKVAAILPRSHCLVLQSIKSRTFKSPMGSCRKIGVFGNHLCDTTPISWPSPTLQDEPSHITFLASNRSIHRCNGQFFSFKPF